jgi:hypothetical protein
VPQAVRKGKGVEAQGTQLGSEKGVKEGSFAFQILDLAHFSGANRVLQDLPLPKQLSRPIRRGTEVFLEVQGTHAS